ncbi:hypothetical protein ACM26V_01280 [Salipaludibacillus sp. HK11]|uniref:hypothetical protein n=1 Tax=Salipaludibacillus sp. HK11 TaxID=3394320 RepID=UPI0039FDAC84
MQILTVSLLTLIFITQLLILFIIFKKMSLANKTELESVGKPVKDNELLENDWEEEVKRTVELQLMRIRNAVQKQTNSIHKKEIEIAPKSLIFDDKILIKVYNEEERALLYTYISSFNTYLERFWYTKNGTFKTVFSGSTGNPETHAGQLSRASHELCQHMDLWLNQLHLG